MPVNKYKGKIKLFNYPTYNKTSKEAKLKKKKIYQTKL